jgi:toxin HigB-1
VIILFANNELCRLCLTERLAKRKLGSKNAKKLKTRLADLQAVTRVTALVAGNPHPLKGNRNGQFALRLDGAWRLVFEPTNDLAKGDDDTVDWAKVTEVKIVEIEDYHD